LRQGNKVWEILDVWISGEPASVRAKELAEEGVFRKRDDRKRKLEQGGNGHLQARRWLEKST